MRFVHVTTFYPPESFGGDGVFVQRLAEGLVREGHEVDIVYCGDSYRALSGSPAGPALDDGPVRVHRLESGWGVASPLYSYLTGRPGPKGPAIRRLLEDRQPDVIHFHNVSLMGAPHILRYGKARKLYTMHEHWLACPTHVLFQYGRRACETPHCLPCLLSQGRPPQPWRYGGGWRKKLGQIDSFLSPSEFTRQRHLRAGFDIPIRKVPLFTPPPSAGEAPGEDGPFFLIAGRLEKLKGIHTVLPLFDGGLAARLVIAGDGACRPALERQAAGNPRIRFAGQLPWDALCGLYRNAVAVLAPSLAPETFGLTVAEAAAHGTPSIVRDLGALPELVRDGGCGLICRNEREMKQAMERLVQDASLRLEFGRNGVRAWQRLWSWKAHYASYRNVLASVSGAAA